MRTWTLHRATLTQSKVGSCQHTLFTKAYAVHRVLGCEGPGGDEEGGGLGSKHRSPHQSTQVSTAILCSFSTQSLRVSGCFPVAHRKGLLWYELPLAPRSYLGSSDCHSIYQQSLLNHRILIAYTATNQNKSELLTTISQLTFPLVPEINC